MHRTKFYAIMATFLLVATATADDTQEKAIEKDRQQIKGTWRIVKLEVNGNQAAEQDARKLTVVNGLDDTWALFSEGKEIAKGTNVLNPTQTPKTIDFTITDGDSKDKKFVGIYELGEKSRKLCFAPAEKERPKEFAAPTGSEQIFVVFEREK